MGEVQRLIVIPPTEIVAGIVFHLTDLRVAVSVSRRSIDKTLARLNKNEYKLTVNRIDWRNLTDADRLLILANESGTAVTVNVRGVASLKDDLYDGSK